MDIVNLERFAHYAHGLAGWTDSLIFAIENPEHVPVDREAMTPQEWREHCESMVGAQRVLIGHFYNAVEEWQNV